jgi:hypothetical protein
MLSLLGRRGALVPLSISTGLWTRVATEINRLARAKLGYDRMGRTGAFRTAEGNGPA